jgi:hypothetical protein
VASLAVAGLLLYALGGAGTSSALVGNYEGYAFSAEGVVVGDSQSHNRVDLLPGGSVSGAINDGNGGATYSASDASSACSGVEGGAVVSATCATTVQDFVFSVGGLQIVGADEVTVVSHSHDFGGAPVSDSTGTTINGTCVRQTLLGACEPQGREPTSLTLRMSRVA